MRTAWAESGAKDYSNAKDIKSIKRKGVCGPLLTCTDNNGTEILFPTPADSWCLTHEAETTIYRLVPKALQQGEGTDIKPKLNPIFPLVNDNEKLKGKPAKDTLKFWFYKNMQAWLLSDTSDQLPANEQGIQNLPVEIRTHVSINPETHTARTGHLFQTAGLDFSRQRAVSDENNKQWGWQQKEYALACQFQEDFGNTYRTIGGESRLGKIEKVDNLIPDCPSELGKIINQSKGFRLILVTPAIFEQGYIPDWIDKDSMQGNYRGMKLKLHAVAVSRWQAGTSWDMASTASKTGKGMRSLKRLVPAGTVYWFERLSGTIQASGFWITSISNEDKPEQRANDGYGLTILGIWNIPENLKANKEDNT
jgi:CRISPR-associated protein Cmr3